MKIPFIPRVITLFNRFLTGAYIPHTAIIGKGTKFSYGGAAVVIHARAKIGNNCTIGPAVTLGRRKGNGVPSIGDNVFIGGGAKILGGIRIGDNSVIGVNSIIINDIPANSLVVADISQVKRRNISRSDIVEWT